MKTSETLTLGISALDIGISGFSGGGECTLTFEDASAERVRGSFECADWDVGGKKITAKGTFEASK